MWVKRYDGRRELTCFGVASQLFEKAAMPEVDTVEGADGYGRFS
jgi:hypothetical protein